MIKSMRVGIDLGSTYSTISSYNIENDQPEPLLIGGTAATPSIPSVVCIDEDDGRVYEGIQAKELIGDDMYTFFEAFKMLLIEEDKNALSQNGYSDQYTPRKITAIFLRSILAGIKRRNMYADVVFECVYICVPETWCSEIRNIGALDGKSILREILLYDINSPEIMSDENDTEIKVNDVRVVTEPEAASAFFARNYEKEKCESFNGHLLLVDYGGGTLDLTLTEVISNGEGEMEIAYRDSGGAGQNHRDENGAYRVGSAGLDYMRTVLRYAFEDSGFFEKDFIPDTNERNYMTAFRNLESNLKNHPDEIESIFSSYGSYSEMKDILSDKAMQFYKVSYRGKKIIITYQHLYRAYRDVIEPVLKGELTALRPRVKRYIKSDPFTVEAGIKDDFKIAIVGGFGSFYLVREQIAEMCNFIKDPQKDKRVWDISADKSELAVSFGASLLAAGKVKLRKTARISIGIVSNKIVGLEGGKFEAQPVVWYGIKWHQKLDAGIRYFILNDDSKPDTPGNRHSFGGSFSTGLGGFVVEKTGNFKRGRMFLIKPDFRKNFEDIPTGTWNIGFSVDQRDVLSMHFIDVDDNDNQIQIKLDRLDKLFLPTDVREIELRNGKWCFSGEMSNSEV